jgi:hypothetical protein
LQTSQLQSMGKNLRYRDKAVRPVKKLALFVGWLERSDTQRGNYQRCDASWRALADDSAAERVAGERGAVRLVRRWVDPLRC